MCESSMIMSDDESLTLWLHPNGQVYSLLGNIVPQALNINVGKL